jgi:hypothetical protein
MVNEAGSGNISNVYPGLSKYFVLFGLNQFKFKKERNNPEYFSLF